MIDALFDLLGSFYQRGDLIQTEALALGILRAVPEDIVSLVILGLVYYRTQRKGAAAEIFNTVETRLKSLPAPQSANHNTLAAVHCLRASSENGSLLAGAWYDSGVVMLKLKKFKPAITAFQAALSARPDLALAKRAMDIAYRAKTSVRRPKQVIQHLVPAM